jgi:hypothetical protein
LWAYAYDSDETYRLLTHYFYFPLKPVTISGPSTLRYKEQGTYTANTSGGSETIAYQWYMRPDRTNYWQQLGNGRTQTVTMTTRNFTIKVEVSSGNEFYENTKYVKYDDSPPAVKATETVVAIPKEYALHPNFPNPFNAVTAIKYDLPENSLVRLRIYDLMGREVWSMSGDQDAGYREVHWSGKDQYGKPVASGVYLYAIQVRSLESDKTFARTRKLLLLR